MTARGLQQDVDLGEDRPPHGLAVYRVLTGSRVACSSSVARSLAVALPACILTLGEN
jgi:hypothetical protein